LSARAERRAAGGPEPPAGRPRHEAPPTPPPAPPGRHGAPISAAPGSAPPSAWPASAPPGRQPASAPPARTPRPDRIELPAPIQARARVGADRSAATSSSPAAVPRPRRLRRPGWLGRVHVVQIMWWQILVAAVIAVSNQGTTVLGVAAGAAILLAVPSIVYIRRRPLYGWLASWLRFRLRRRTVTAGLGDARTKLLDYVLPSTVVTELDVDGEPAAALTHTDGVTAVLELRPLEGALLAGPAQPLPSIATALTADDRAAPMTTVQLLVQVLPAPAAQAGTGVLAESYRELTGGAVPAQRRAWIAVQVRRTPDRYADAELLPALSFAVRRLRRRLRQDNVANRLLDRDELLSCTVMLAGVDAGRPGIYGAPRGQPLAREGWHAVVTGNGMQSAYRLVRWPVGDWPIDRLLCSVPATANTLAMAVARDPAAGRFDELAVELGIRLLAPDLRQLAAAERSLVDAVRESEGLIERLDGQQRWGLAATLPFGGFLR
jgi:type VII secretion protein EccE